MCERLELRKKMLACPSWFSVEQKQTQSHLLGQTWSEQSNLEERKIKRKTCVSFYLRGKTGGSEKQILCLSLTKAVPFPGSFPTLAIPFHESQITMAVLSTVDGSPQGVCGDKVHLCVWGREREKEGGRKTQEERNTIACARLPLLWVLM